MIDKYLNIIDSVCTGCSACTEACTFPDANGIKPIQLVKNKIGLAVPRINTDTCTNCMMCYKACPAEDKIFNQNITFEKYIESVGDCYFGYSLDDEHRFEAATAGVATGIAAYLLKTKQIDGVVSSYQNDDNEIVTEIFTDGKEIKKTRGSIYRQISLLNGLAEKIENGKHKKLLVIGLPCHIAGLKTLKKVNKYLRKHVVFITISLFCKQVKTESFSDVERDILKAKPNQKIDYRGKGWPGITRVAGGQRLPFNNIKLGLMWGSFAFAPKYCFACSDPLGVEADISVGDAWLRKYYADKIGSSFFVANTPKGKEIITAIILSENLFAENETISNVVSSQNINYIRFKTLYAKARSSFFTDFEEQYDVPFRYKSLMLWIICNKKMIEFLYQRKLVGYIPEIFLKVYARATGSVFRSVIGRK